MVVALDPERKCFRVDPEPKWPVLWVPQRIFGGVLKTTWQHPRNTTHVIYVQRRSTRGQEELEAKELPREVDRETGGPFSRSS